jgi:hypothetical protein
MMEYRCHFFDADGHLRTVEAIESETIDGATAIGIRKLAGKPEAAGFELWLLECPMRRYVRD